jgi:hypothetical protein
LFANVEIFAYIYVALGEPAFEKIRVATFPEEHTDHYLGRQFVVGAIEGDRGDEADWRMLIAKLTEFSGNPRDACLRFVRQFGIARKRSYRERTKREQQRLLDLITALPVEEAARILNRPPGSVRSMLHRLGIGGRTGRGWFTKYSLSRALCTLVPTKYRNGSVSVGLGREPLQRLAYRRMSSMPMISVIL